MFLYYQETGKAVTWPHTQNRERDACESFLMEVRIMHTKFDSADKCLPPCVANANDIK